MFPRATPRIQHAALEAAALLRLAGKPLPAEDRTAAILNVTATAFDLDRDALARLADLRQQERTSADISVLFAKILVIVARLADTAAELK